MDPENSAAPSDPHAPAQDTAPGDRVADPFEQEISARYAAHAPSHRSAWKRPENGESGYSWYRKGDANTDRGRETGQLDNEEQARISGLATSMPVHIALPKPQRKASGLGLEPKTSLSEREGRLVPPLMAAMKQRGLDVPVPRLPSQGHAGQSGGQGKEGSRRVSTTVGTAMDPGVLVDLESRMGQLGRSGSEDDEEEDEDEEGEDEDQQGTLRQSGFVPPHVIARNQQRKGVDAGIRSIYDE